MTLEEQLAPLATDLANALADKKKAEQRADEVKHQIRALLETAGPGTYQAGLETVRATIVQQVDLDKVAQTYPAATHPYLYGTAKPDTKLVRAHLDEEQVEDFLKPAGDLRIGLS